jgi:hypothetical protein
MRDFELIYFEKPQPQFIIIDVTERASATQDNPFGVCVNTSPSGGPEGANYNPGALKGSGCPSGREFVQFEKFLADTAMAGLAIAVPFAAPALVPALSIPGVGVGIVVGVGVAVGGYYLYQWLTAPTPQQLVNNAVTQCAILCSVAAAAADAAISVVSTTAVFASKDIPIQAINRAARNVMNKVKRSRFPLFCCGLWCGAFHETAEEITGCEGENCMYLCIENCAREAENTGFWEGMEGGCAGIISQPVKPGCSCSKWGKWVGKYMCPNRGR